MSLFSKPCAICGISCGNYGMLKDKAIICQKCQRKASLGLLGRLPANTTLQEAKDLIFGKSEMDSGNFNPTKAVSAFLAVDNVAKKFSVRSKLERIQQKRFAHHCELRLL